ncbi:MAG TPA: AGE family epimerase/isomerase [Candidatus Didemnitutus sp.]|nr:AGE family epimerase/isomerase [Candidatus Didemnitutus sp.]
MAPSFPALARQYRGALFEDVIPFWERHSLDRVHGGYFTCLARDGSIYDRDKFIWLQARQVWTFAMLHNEVEARGEWLAVARHGADFLRQYGRDPGGNWYFSVAENGRPLIAPYNIFSDCFAAMAFGQFARASGSDEDRRLALDAYENVLRRERNPKGAFTKALPDTRPLISLAVPMILTNLTVELEWLLDPAHTQAIITRCLNEMFDCFLDESRHVLREYVAPDGAKRDCFEGRLVNPGHGIEGMWFAMDVAERRQDRALLERAVEVALRTVEFGWDERHGGIFYFLDAAGHPPQQLEWDQKLWWVHVEALVAMLKGYRLTGRPECLRWFQRLHEYTWSHYPDPEFGEWFGYLNRQGEVLLPLKGGKWKGCFHIPRSLRLCLRECERLAEQPAPTVTVKE